MTHEAPEPYRFPSGHHLVRCYPVEGEPFVEFWFGEEVWGQVKIADVDHDATGEARLANCTFTVSLYGRGRGTNEWWTFSLHDVREQLDKAEAALRENEVRRMPVEAEGLSAAGHATSKMGSTLRTAGKCRYRRSMDDAPSHAEVLLAAGRALWEVPTPRLRAVAVAWDDRCLYPRLLYDGPPQTRSASWSRCSAPTSSPTSRPSRWTRSAEPVPYPSPLELRSGEVWVYLRHEGASEGGQVPLATAR